MFQETWDWLAAETRKREALASEASVIRSSGAWVRFDGEKWLAMRIGELAITSAGATVEEAIGGLEGR